MWEVQEGVLLQWEMPGEEKSHLDNAKCIYLTSKRCQTFICVQKGDWSMHKLECSAMTAFGDKWCPTETARLMARILAKKVGVSAPCGAFGPSSGSRSFLWGNVDKMSLCVFYPEIAERKICVREDSADRRDAVT